MSPALLIGATSFIGKCLGTLPGIKAISHNDPNLTDVIKSHDVIINCAFHPALRTEAYTIEHDFDNWIAKQISTTSQRLVILSSRSVYGQTQDPMHEEMALHPTTTYGMNKTKIEENCRNILGNRLLALRLSNAFGYEWPIQAGRVTFMSQVLNSLKKEHKITFDIAATSEKDFLPVTEVASIISKLVNLEATGNYNVGAGISLSMSSVAAAIIRGFGDGTAIFESPRIDNFYMDISKLKKLVPDLPQKTEILYEFEKIGQRLAAAEKDKI